MSEKGFVALAFILGIVLLSASVVGGSFYIKQNNPELIEKLTVFTKPDPTPQTASLAKETNESVKKITDAQNKAPKNTFSKITDKLMQSVAQNNTPAAPSAPSLIAFVEDQSDETANNISRQIRVYDLSKRKLIEVDQSLTANNDGLPWIGPLSPDGKYLPVYYVHPGKRPLFFYNLQDNKAIKLLENIESGGSPNDTFWLDNQTFAYDIEYHYKTKDDNVLVVNQKGEQSKIPLPSPNPASRPSLIFANSRISASYPILDILPSEQAQVTIDGTSLPGNPKGLVVGLSDNFLVTLESPARSSAPLEDIMPKVSPQTTEQEAQDALAKAFQPKGNWLLNFYKLPEGKLEKSIIAQDPGWVVKSALIRPNKNTIIIHQQDKIVFPSFSRYTEVDPKQPNQRKIISEEAGTSALSNIISGGNNTFEITQDGTWLIGLQPSGSKSTLGENLIQIIAWNIDTKEKVVICQKEKINCVYLRVYNPLELRAASSEETIAKSSRH